MSTTVIFTVGNHFGRLLRNLREFKGISQTEMSRRSGLAQSQISTLERFAEPPTIRIIGKALSALGKDRLELRFS
jgi:transcriptional regulator with XRE-family HTH domain